MSERKPCVSDERLLAMLAEDVPYGDLTTRSLGIASQPAWIRMRARRAMRLCGSEEAARLIELSGARVHSCEKSGVELAGGALILEAEGSAEALHWVWKTAQTLMEYLSGIASHAAEIIAVLREAGFDLPLACTRKNLPGTREFVVKAVHAGGAISHRLGLSETLLVFPEHREFVDKATMPEVFARLKRANPEKRLVVEVKDMEEAFWLAQCGAEVLQLERFTPEELAECRRVLKACSLDVLLAPAGGVKCDNAVAYARAGADFLVSSAPYFASPRDVEVRFSVA